MEEDLKDVPADEGFIREEAISRAGLRGDHGDEGQGSVRGILRSHGINHALVDCYR